MFVQNTDGDQGSRILPVNFYVCNWLFRVLLSKPTRLGWQYKTGCLVS